MNIEEMRELQKDHDELDKLARELVDKINNTNKKKLKIEKII